MKFHLVFILFILGKFSLHAQEFNCQVSIIKDQKLEVTSVELEIFDQLKQTITDLMNNTQWTKDKYKVEERVNCNIQLQIRSIPSPGVYKGSLQVQVSRPVFNTSYNSTLFNFQDDDIEFAYSRNAVMVYAPNQFRDNLTSIIAFYAYFMLGMDSDSFSLKGGTKHFNEAQQLVMNAQASGAKGWMSNEQGKRNRYWLVDNALQELFEPFRICNYEYHRLGLDQMYQNNDASRKAIFDALNRLNQVVSARPNSVNIVNFVQSKQVEIKNIFLESEMSEKNSIVNLMKKIDPANSQKYEEILR